MIDQPFRQILPGYTQKLIQFYQSKGWTPNQITFASFGIALVAATAVAFNAPILALGLWWLGRLLDGTDGIYARETGQASDLGAFYDIVFDMASYSVMILGFAYAYPAFQGAWLLILALYVLCITSALALGALLEKRPISSKDNRGIRLAAGLAEGGETGIAYSLFLVFPDYLFWLTSVWIVILVVTVVARFVLAKKVLTPFL